MRMRRFAVLMTVHDRREKTLRCLRSLYGQSLAAGWGFDVFLTDDGCTDGTPEAVASEFPQVNIVKGDGTLFWNRGMLRAWESAAAHADYDAYLWLNDDTYLLPGALESLTGCLELHPDAIVVGSTRATDSETLTYGGMDAAGNYVMPGTVPLRCHTFNGNVVMVSRPAFRRIGFLDAAYSHSLGDIDYGLSAIARGVEAYMAPGFAGMCDTNATGPKWLDTTLPVRVRLRNLFSPLGYTNPPEYFHYKRKHWGLGQAMLAMVSITIHFISPRLWAKIK